MLHLLEKEGPAVPLVLEIAKSISFYGEIFCW